MARPRAADHADKRAAFLRSAARLFAEQGYDRASMAEIAAAVGVSKALLYHYYTSKEALLFDILHAHIIDLVEAVEGADDASLAPEARLECLIGAVLEAYRDADAEHKVQITHLSTLPADLQKPIKDAERRLVKCFAAVVAAIDPTLPRDLVTPVTMSLFGIMNWNFMWFRDGGALTREAYVRLATRLFVNGVRGLAA